MKLRCTNQTSRAMTLFEVIIVIMIIVVLAAISVPLIARSHITSCRISCSNNIKQLGLGYKIWAGDNYDKYPMEVSTASGGAKEWMTTPDAWKAYLVMSNELSTPKVLFCPQDTLRGDYPTQWDDGLKFNLSYFIGLDATNGNPTAILSGDGNLVLNNAPAHHGFVNATTNTSLTWDGTRHLSDPRWFRSRTVYGNIGLGDGSVQMPDNSDLPQYFQQTGLATNRLVIP